MFETGDREMGERGDALLSLRRAIEEERARIHQLADNPGAVAHPDAAARHQKARQRREARRLATSRTPSPDETTPGAPRRPTEPPVADRPQTDERPQSLIGRLWKRGEKPGWFETTAATKNAAGPDAAAAADAARSRPERAATHAASKPATAPLHRRKERDQAPAQPIAASAQASPPRQHDHHSMADTMVVMERGDEDGWKPLIDPMKVIGGIANSKGIIVATTLLGALIGVGMALSTPKLYDAQAEILVDPRALKILDRDLTDVAGLPSDATLAIVENQARVLTSSTVLNKVVERLNLESDPEFNGSDTGIELNPINFVRSLLTRSDGAADPGRRRALAVQNLAESLTVERTGKTFIIIISARTNDGEKSALIANTMTEEFLLTAGDMQSDTATRANDELGKRLDELRQNVEAAERKVEAFKAENDLIGAQGRLITDDEIVKLNDQLSIAKARTIELNGRAQSARSLNADAVLNGASPEAAASGVITELRGQYATAKQEAERLSVRLGPRHPQYQAAQAQVDGAREQIAGELLRINAQVQTELRRAVQLEQELAARLAQLKVRSGDVSSELVTLRELERDATAKRAVYEAYLLRARETGEQKGINTANISVISKAFAPLESAGPSRAVIAGTGGILGLLAGIAIGGLRGAVDSLRESAPTRRRRTAAVRKSARSDPDPAQVSDASATAGEDWRSRAAASVGKPEASAPPPPAVAANQTTQPAAKTAAPIAKVAIKEDDPMTSPYYTPGYVPQPQQQPVYPQQTHQQYPYPPAPPVYPQPAYAPNGYPQQPHYAAPAGYPQQPQAWQPAPPPYYPQPMQPQQHAYASYAPPAYASPQPYPPMPPQYPAAPPQPSPLVQASNEGQAMGGSLAEIKDSIREFRDAVRELNESRTRRRYF